MSLKRYTPIGGNLAVCDTTQIRFTTPVGAYFLDDEFDFKVAGKTLWAYRWYIMNPSFSHTIKYTLVQSNTLTCATFNDPVKTIPVALSSYGAGRAFKINNTFLIDNTNNPSYEGYKKYNLTTGNLEGTYYSPNNNLMINGIIIQYTKPIGSDGNNVYFTSIYWSNFNYTIAFSNGVILQTDLYRSNSGYNIMDPLVVIMSSKLYVWKNAKKLFGVYDATSGAGLGDYTPILNIDLSNMYSNYVSALASSSDGKTLYIYVEGSSPPVKRFIFSCDTSSPNTPCKKTLIGPSNDSGSAYGLAELRPGVLVTLFNSYANYAVGYVLKLNYYNVPV